MGWQKETADLCTHTDILPPDTDQRPILHVNSQKACWISLFTNVCVVPSYLGNHIEDKYKTQKYYEEEIYWGESAENPNWSLQTRRAV